MEIGITDIIKTLQLETTMPSIIVRKSLITRISVSLDEILARLQNGQELNQKYKSLSKNASDRIINAPETFYTVLRQINFSKEQPEDYFLSYISDAINIELSNEGAEISFDQPAWSAQGDIYVPAGVWNLNTLPHTNSQYNPDQVFFSKKIHNIIIDSSSPRIVRMSESEKNEGFLSETLNYASPEEIDIVLPKIEQALDILKSTSKVVYFIIVSNIKSIYIVSDKRDCFNAISRGAEIGRVALHNAHRADVDVPLIMNSLLHEAIHSFLFSFEQSTPIINHAIYKDERLVPSPWTGCPLTVHTYLHACCVWWGLVNLWNSVVDQLPEDIKPGARQLLSTAQKGFQTGKVLSNLLPYKDQVSPDVFSLMEKIPMGNDILDKNKKWV